MFQILKYKELIAMFEHPKGLYFISAVETITTFGFYGVRIILSLYMVLVLAFSYVLSSQVYGIFSGLIYLTPIIGGYISDRYWGNSRSIFVGILLMAIGIFTLAYSASFYSGILPSHDGFLFTKQEILFLIGLTFMIIGNGFFKPNNSSMISGLYPSKDDIIDAAFTLFYMVLNFGAIFAPIIIGFIVGENPESFEIGFLVSGVVMVIGLIVFILLKKKYLINPEGKPIGKEPNYISQFSCDEKELDFEILKKKGLQHVDLSLDSKESIKIKEKLSNLNRFDKEEIIKGKLSEVEKHRLYVIIIIIFFGTFFFISFEQFGISLTYFTKDYVMLDIGNGFRIPPQSFQALSPLFVVIFAPFFVALWSFLYKHKINISIAIKTGIGLFILTIGFIILCIPGSLIDNGVMKVSGIWIIIIYLFITLAELAFVPSSQVLVSKLAPKKFLSLLMGCWFISTALANIIGGFLSSFYPEPNKSVQILLGIPICGFVEFFLIFAVLSAIAAISIILLHNPIKKWMHWDYNNDY